MKKLFFLLLPVIIFPLFSEGQNNFHFPGTIELGGDIGFSSQSASASGETITILNSDIFFGYMVAPGLEIGLRPGFSFLTSSAETISSYNLFLNPEYNFNTSTNIYPYLGLIAGYTYLSHTDGLGYGGEAGIKFNVNGSSNLLFKFEYVSLYNSVSKNSSENYSINNVSFGLGFRIFFVKAAKIK